MFIEERRRLSDVFNVEIGLYNFMDEMLRFELNKITRIAAV